MSADFVATSPGVSRLPLISVCIVVFNGYESIGEAVSSVVLQTYPAVELLVIDGGSTDGTLQVLEQYSTKISALVSEPDLGIYDAMNKARAIAKGEWLVFLGCDDVLLDCLSDMSAYLKNDSAVYYGDVIIKSTGKVFGGYFSKYRLMQVNICHQAIFYPQKVYAAHAYDLSYRYLADYEYNFRLVGQGVRFIYAAVTVAIFNILGASTGGDPAFERDRLRLIGKHFGAGWLMLKKLRTFFVSVLKPSANLK